MKVNQAQQVFEPVTITLETLEEAVVFMSIVDLLDSHHSNANVDRVKLTPSEYEIVRQLSNRFGELPNG